MRRLLLVAFCLEPAIGFGGLSYIYKNALTQFQYENEVSKPDDDDDAAID